MWNSSTDPFLSKECKSDANKRNFEIKLNLTCQSQSIPNNIRILTKAFCIFCPNVVVLASIGGELWRGQTQNRGKFRLQLDPEGQGQSPHKTIRILTKLFCTPLIQIGGSELEGVMRYRADKLVIDGHMDTNSGNDNTRKS